MIPAILLGIACEAATPLPPSARDTRRVKAQMVAAGDVRGYLVRTAGSTEGILLLTSVLDEQARTKAKTFSGATVLAVAPTTDASKSRTYLEGLEGIERVTLVCARARCPEITPGTEQSSPQTHEVTARPGPPAGQQAIEAPVH